MYTAILHKCAVLKNKILCTLNVLNKKCHIVQISVVYRVSQKHGNLGTN